MNTWYKPGANVAVSSNDLTNCEVEAVQKVPPNVVTRSSPVVVTPTLNACYGTGGTLLCAGAPFGYPATRYSQVDLNRDLRARVVDQCMAAKGYAPVSLPECSAEQRARLPQSLSTSQAPTEASCVLRTNRDTWAIVTPEARG